MTSPPEADLGPFSSLAERLQEITEALAATNTQQEVVEIVLTPAIRSLGAIAGVVLLVDQADQQLKIAGSQGYTVGASTLWKGGPVGDHQLISDILHMREASYFEHVGALRAAYPDLEHLIGALASVANAVIPMFLDNRPLGVIVLDFKEPHHFTPAERRFLRILAAQCAVALGRVAATVLLEARVEARTRQLREERRAQGAFVAFTESIGSESDLFALIRQAVTVLQGRFPGASVVYYEPEPEGHLWKARLWSDDLSPDLLVVVSAGLPSDTPLFAKVMQTRQPVFTDGWDAERENVASSEQYGAAAIYPLLIGGELHSLLSVGLRNTRRWNDADRALLRAVGRGLNLALERTETSRQLKRQNAELQARTHALEAFAELTRDLTLTTDPLLLIQRAQQVMMSMLANGSVLYYELQDGRWINRLQHGSLNSPALQAVIDLGVPYAEASTLLLPWTTGEPQFQDVYDHGSDALAPGTGLHIAATASLRVSVRGTPLGVLAIVLFEQRAWSNVDRVVLETAVQSLELALDRAAQTQTLEEERTALEAFTRFTEAVGSETDVQVLVHQAISLLVDTCGVDVAYLERGGELFRATAWNPLFDPALLTRLEAGFPLRQSNLALLLRAHAAAFIDHWDAAAQWIEESAHLKAVAGYSHAQDGEMQSVLLMGSRTSASWTERNKRIFRAVGRSLDLALDRARQTRMVTDQRDALDHRTRELSVVNEELQAFSYSVSHDLRTPVRHMIGFLQLARRSLEGKLDERSARYLEVVEQAGTQMNTLIDALLNLSRAAQQAMSPQTVDLNAVMEQLHGGLLPDLMTRNVRWEVSPLPSVLGDPDALKQVLTQLTENALKFTRTREVAVIRVWAEDQGETWGIFVQDNGLGFDPRYRDRLFNLFQRLHSADQATGTGVGLASVRRLVMKHGGQVIAEGEVGKGATFGFTLPKAPP